MVRLWEPTRGKRGWAKDTDYMSMASRRHRFCVGKSLGFGPHYVSSSQSWITVGLKSVFLKSQLNMSLYGIFPSDLRLKKNSFLQWLVHVCRQWRYFILRHRKPWILAFSVLEIDLQRTYWTCGHLYLSSYQIVLDERLDSNWRMRRPSLPHSGNAIAYISLISMLSQPCSETRFFQWRSFSRCWQVWRFTRDPVHFWVELSHIYKNSTRMALQYRH